MLIRSYKSQKGEKCSAAGTSSYGANSLPHMLTLGVVTGGGDLKRG